MDTVEQQFHPIGTKHEVPQSQEICTQTSPKETEASESSSEESDDSGDYAIMFPDEKAPGQFKPKFFDKEGYQILNMTAKCLEKKKKRQTKKQKKSKSVTQQKRAEPVGILRASVATAEQPAE